jgi:hypothetical protein
MLHELGFAFQDTSRSWFSLSLSAPAVITLKKIVVPNDLCYTLTMLLPFDMSSRLNARFRVQFGVVPYKQASSQE